MDFVLKLDSMSNEDYKKLQRNNTHQICPMRRSIITALKCVASAPQEGKQDNVVRLLYVSKLLIILIKYFLYIWFDVCLKLGVGIGAGVAGKPWTTGRIEDQGALKALSQICNLAGEMGQRGVDGFLQQSLVIQSLPTENEGNAFFNSG
ncbi:hypothetical protein [Undibacterium sp. TJN19]|uniref:hypothetical protein n=1 Tax=Undibacterium sp. TJN19 TaxID=3413055 RepID=UPI003BF3B17D